MVSTRRSRGFIDDKQLLSLFFGDVEAVFSQRKVYLNKLI